MTYGHAACDQDSARYSVVTKLLPIESGLPPLTKGIDIQHFSSSGLSQIYLHVTLKRNKILSDLEFTEY